MRGQYKVPGGKLVAVGLETRDGHLADVSVSGDFFLDPDEALAVIDRSLSGLPEDASVARLSSAIDTALTAAYNAGELAWPATMIGFDSRAIAMAVRRALGRATTWDDHVFDVIHPGPLPPPLHTALDQVIGEEVAAGRRGPTLRFWEWETPAVIFGSFQSLSNEIDSEAAERLGVQVIRRISGGGAMFMEGGNCITFSLYVPTTLVDGLSFEESYSFLDSWVIDALRDVGVEAGFTGMNDIASPAGKLAGAAQKRFAPRDGHDVGSVLHHVTMAYDIDQDKMMQVLRIGREKLSDKGTRSANKRVDPVRSQTQMAREDVIESFRRTFERLYRTRPSELTADELAQAHELMENKFTSPQWTARVP